ncbi:MAG: hypothetical protein AAF414_10405 [Pseudomonadota bacterium]
MTFKRRDMIGLAVTGAAILATGRVSMAATSHAETIAHQATDFFGENGFAALPPFDLIVDQAFNGGVRYGIIQQVTLPRASMGIVPLARTEDLAERQRPGVLAYFNVFAFQTEPGSEPGLAMDLVMEFLVNRTELDPRKLLFVSTERFRPYLGRNDYVTADRFFERPLAEAVSMGDGSGYIASLEHPDRPSFHTVGLYYPLPGTDPERPSSYPPPGFIEIGEVAIEPIDGDPNGPEGAGLGLERLAMAQGQSIPDFEESRTALLQALEDEAARRGIALPPAYETFSSH